MRRSLRSWLGRVPLEQEVDGEIAFHVEMRTRELVERGIDPNAAREAALGRFGDLANLKRTCVDLGRKRDRDMRLTQWMREFRADVVFAVRQLRREWITGARGTPPARASLECAHGRPAMLSLQAMGERG